MRELLLAVTLLAAAAGSVQACSCVPPGDDEAAYWRERWAFSQAVVLAEIMGESSEPTTSWLSRDHVLGWHSPLHLRPLLHLVVKHRWKGDFAVGTALVVEKVDGSMCGYERWTQARHHLLYLTKNKHWVASLCGMSHPVFDTASAIRKQDAEIARFLRDESTRQQR
ncbi:hypothetical protein [Roseateles sp. LYH14W]|uniref:Uncharacterized protein n=1 Tax=Pelomonas parva TaxID=3299032 RepID=A0ABW7F599_9BURK